MKFKFPEKIPCSNDKDFTAFLQALSHALKTGEIDASNVLIWLKSSSGNNNDSQIHSLVKLKPDYLLRLDEVVLSQLSLRQRILLFSTEDRHGCLPLYYSSNHGQLEEFSALWIFRVINFGIENRYGITPASYLPDIKTVNLVLTQMINILEKQEVLAQNIYDSLLSGYQNSPLLSFIFNNSLYDSKTYEILFRIVYLLPPKMRAGFLFYTQGQNVRPVIEMLMFSSHAYADNLIYQFFIFSPADAVMHWLKNLDKEVYLNFYNLRRFTSLYEKIILMKDYFLYVFDILFLTCKSKSGNMRNDVFFVHLFDNNALFESVLAILERQFAARRLTTQQIVNLLMMEDSEGKTCLYHAAFKKEVLKKLLSTLLFSLSARDLLKLFGEQDDIRLSILSHILSHADEEVMVLLIELFERIDHHKLIAQINMALQSMRLIDEKAVLILIDWAFAHVDRKLFESLLVSTWHLNNFDKIIKKCLDSQYPIKVIEYIFTITNSNSGKLSLDNKREIIYLAFKKMLELLVDKAITRDQAMTLFMTACQGDPRKLHDLILLNSKICPISCAILLSFNKNFLASFLFDRRNTSAISVIDLIILKSKMSDSHLWLRLIGLTDRRMIMDWLEGPKINYIDHPVNELEEKFTILCENLINSKEYFPYLYNILLLQNRYTLFNVIFFNYLFVNRFDLLEKILGVLDQLFAARKLTLSQICYLLTVKDNQGDTPLHLVSSRTAELKMLLSTLLLPLSSSDLLRVLNENNHGITPLSLIFASADEEIITLLLNLFERFHPSVILENIIAALKNVSNAKKEAILLLVDWVRINFDRKTLDAFLSILMPFDFFPDIMRCYLLEGLPSDEMLEWVNAHPAFLLFIDELENKEKIIFINNLLAHPHLRADSRQELTEKQKVCLSHSQYVGLPLTYKTLDLAISSELSDNVVPPKKTLFWSHPRDEASVFVGVIKSFLHHILNKKVSPFDELSDDEVLNLLIIFDDYQSTLREKKLVDVGFSRFCEKLFQTETLKPYSKVKKVESDDDKTNPPEDLEKIQKCLDNLKGISHDVRNSCNISIKFLLHIITDINKILSFFSWNYGRLYYMPGEINVALHTDWVKRGETAEFKERMLLFVNNFIAAFKLAEAQGKIPDFFGKLYGGYCIEGRVESVFDWAITMASLPSIHDVLEPLYQRYCAYCRVMKGEEDYNIEHAFDFMYPRCKDLPCKPDEIYAPKGKILRAGIIKYLSEVLSLDMDDASLKFKIARLL